MQYLKHFGEKLLNAVAAVESAGAVNLLGQTREHTVHVEYSSSTVSGVVTIEIASEKSYTGTWDALTTVPWAAGNRSHSFRFTGAIGAMRARISTVVVGGTVTATFYAN